MTDYFTGAETLITLIHGESGVGKSPVSATSPAPRLHIDTENRARFVKGRKVYWDPFKEAPPEVGDWDTCVVQGRDFATVVQIYQWLNSGQHPFRSVIIDSLTELQKRARDAIFAEGVGAGSGGAEDMNERRWGILLQRMEKVIRDYRDLVVHQVKPVQCIVFTALTDDKKGKWRPFVQGSLAVALPGFVDLIGYLYVDTDDSGSPVRKMLVQPMGPYVAKDSTSELPTGGVSGIYGPVVPGPINLDRLIRDIYGV